MSPAKRQLLQYHPENTVRPEDYTPHIGADKVEALKKLAGPLEGKKWTHINSTFLGGGVAEMLKSVLPLAISLGIKAEWNNIQGHDSFYRVTKKFHNMLQGQAGEISLEEIFGAYLNTIEENAHKTFIASDLVIIHDPQPAALVMNGVIYGNTLWRCHIDTSYPNPIIWRFLLPYINHCAGAIFTLPAFIGPGIQVPVYQIMPCIDPLAQKNHMYTDKEAEKVLAPLFNKHNIDSDRPIIAAISRYDIHKNQSSIIKAFHLRAFQEVAKKRTGPKPYLIFLGNTATDDPEGEEMLERLKNEAQNDPDIKFWVNVEDNDRVVGALMKKAAMFTHVSTKEGFGLVVTEAAWQGTPVIGSNVGGIQTQIIEGQTGFLTDPLDIDTLKQRMSYLLDKPDQAKAMGEKGRDHIRRNFLLPELMRRYLTLLRFYSRVDHELPEFRLDRLSYSEIVSFARECHPYLKPGKSS